MDVNTASPRELQQLPGVGCVTARLIVEARPFAALEELLNVKGIGPAKYAAIVAQKQIFVDDRPWTRNGDDVSTKTIDLNVASTRQLQQLKGVGPVLAQRIADARPFHRKEDLLAVKGIGTASYLKMQLDVRVGTANKGPARSFEGQDRGQEASEGDGSGVKGFEERASQTFHICREVEWDVRGSVFPHEIQRATTTKDHRKLLVASWNIRNISRRKETPLLQRIAEVLEEFDLVALQEVRDTIVLKRLKTMLPGWDYIVSDSVGHTRKRAEYFAFFFRRGVVRPIDKCSLLGEATNVFVRPPCIATFQTTKQSGLPGLELALMNVHVSFGEKEIRHQEIAEINKLAMELSRQEPAGRKIVVLGDFNLCPHDVLGSLGSGRMALIRSPLSTTVFGKLYDNIWLDQAQFNNNSSSSSNGKEESGYLVDSGVLRIDWRFYPPSKSNRFVTQNPLDSMIPRLQTYMARVQCGYELSDHCPVWVAFAKAGSSSSAEANDETEG
ncbi:hypothetical protein BBJ28_00023108 [Nothophytophthora sp. Chile5]|nr:hypothetical protein BBJ28_00023108 [Nothophytophthora sp. Chile5]